MTMTMFNVIKAEGEPEELERGDANENQTIRRG